MKKNPLFWVPLSIKLLFFLFISNSVATDLFIPFLDKALLNMGSNPWNLLPAQYFPYGSVLFFIMIVPKGLFYLLFGEAALGTTLLSLVAIKIPILIADLCLLRLLLHYPSEQNKKWIYYFYWMNPVLFFINYIHVQLDVFTVFFVFLSLDLIRRKKENGSAVSLAAAILCKFHMILLAPLFLAFFWNSKFKNEARRFIPTWSGLLLSLVALGFLPHLLSSHLGYISVQSPEAMKIFSLSYKLDGENQLFIGFGLVVALMARLLLSSRITQQGLVYASGVLLGALLISTSSMPGWYYWFYPFIAIFLSQYASQLQPVAVATFAFYLVYFVTRQFGGANGGIFPSISFTLLQMSLLGLLIGIWIFVIQHEMPWMRRRRPLLIGIAGDSGVGKNTLSHTLFDLFGQNATALIEGDDYHKWERDNEKWQDYSHLNPRANYLETLARHVSLLLQGQPIYKSHYDHSVGRFTNERLINSHKNIIVQGLHTFYPILLRKMYDIKIFIHPHEKLRQFWKIRRDHLERGKSLDTTIQSLQARQYDSLLHIGPQRQYSDWILEYIPMDKNFLTAKMEKLQSSDFKLNPELYQVHRIVNDTPVENLIDQLKKVPTLIVSCESDTEDMDFLKIQIQGTIDSQAVESIALLAFGTLRHLTRSSCEPIWKNNYDGINQLIFMALVHRQDFKV